MFFGVQRLSCLELYAEGGLADQIVVTDFRTISRSGVLSQENAFLLVGF